MKKITLVSMLLIAFFNAFTQSGFRLSLKGGAGVSSFYNANMYSDDAIMVLPGVGYCIGGEFGYNAKWYNYGVTTGIYLRSYGNHFEIPGINGVPTVTNYTTLTGLEIPLLMRFRPTGDQRTKTVTMGGPYFEFGAVGFILNEAKQKSTNSLTGESTYDVSSLYQSQSANLVIGFGSHQYGLERFGLTHGIRIHLNVLDITSDDFKGLSYKGNEYKGTFPICIQYLMAATLKFPTN